MKKDETFKPDLSKSKSRTRVASGSSLNRNASCSSQVKASKNNSAKRGSILFENAKILEAKKRKAASQTKQVA